MVQKRLPHKRIIPRLHSASKRESGRFSLCLACCQRPAGRGMVMRPIGEWLLRSWVVASISAGRMPTAR